MRKILLSLVMTGTLAAAGVGVASPSSAHTVDGPFYFTWDTTWDYCVSQLDWVRATPGVYQAGCADTGLPLYPAVIEYWTYDGAHPFG